MVPLRCAGLTSKGKQCKITTDSTLRDDRCGSVLASELLRGGGRFCSFHAKLFETCVYDVRNQHAHVFFIDLETTGLDVARSYIVEFAAVDLESNAIFSTIIRPPGGIQSEERGIHGIPADEINTGVDFKTAFDRFLSFVATLNKRRARHSAEVCETVLAAHNGKKFDFPMLVRECVEYEIPIRVMDRFKFVDTLEVVSALEDGMTAPKCHKLQCLGMAIQQDAFGIGCVVAHRALDDSLKLKKVCIDLSDVLGITPMRLVAEFAEQLECESTLRTWNVLRRSVAHERENTKEENFAQRTTRSVVLPTEMIDAIIRREAGGCAIPSTPVCRIGKMQRNDTEACESPPKQIRRW